MYKYVYVFVFSCAQVPPNKKQKVVKAKAKAMPKAKAKAMPSPPAEVAPEAVPIKEQRVAKAKAAAPSSTSKAKAKAHPGTTATAAPSPKVKKLTKATPRPEDAHWYLQRRPIDALPHDATPVENAQPEIDPNLLQIVPFKPPDGAMTSDQRAWQPDKKTCGIPTQGLLIGLHDNQCCVVCCLCQIICGCYRSKHPDH